MTEASVVSFMSRLFSLIKSYRTDTFLDKSDLMEKSRGYLNQEKITTTKKQHHKS